MIRVTGLCKAWEGKAILRDLDFQLRKGEHVLIMGPSGSGKSTFLHLLARLTTADAGRIEFEGRPIAEMGEPARYRLRQLGLVFQDLCLVESLSVRQNIELIRTHAVRSVHSVDALIGALGLGELQHRKVHSMSRGERQRVALARAVANQPPLILADEPTASLDPSNRDTTLDQLFALAKQTKATVLVVSHDRALLDRPEFHQALSLVDGRLESA